MLPTKAMKDNDLMLAKLFDIVLNQKEIENNGNGGAKWSF